MAFELYASGFNAWNQLRFPHPDLRLFNRRRKDQPAVTTDDSAPDDITSFTCVLKGLVDVIPLSFLSHTASESCLSFSARNRPTANPILPPSSKFSPTGMLSQPARFLVSTRDFSKQINLKINGGTFISLPRRRTV